MTIAIQRKEGGSDTIYFDAVLNYSQSYQSQLTKHPIDRSGRNNSGSNSSITDHAVNENPVFSLKGVVSNADFNSNRPSGFTFTNNNPITNKAYVVKVNKSPLAILQSTFGKQPEPVVNMQQTRSNAVSSVKNLLISIRDNNELITLVEFTTGKITKSELSLVITSLQFNEDPDTGDALIVDMTLERASFVDLQLVRVNKNKVDSSIKDKAQSAVSKGSQNAIEKVADKSTYQEATEFVFDPIARSIGDTLNSIRTGDGKAYEHAIKFGKGLIGIQ
jgi:hypothetical protein